MRRSISVAGWGSWAAKVWDNRVTARNNANHKRRIRSLQSTVVQREDAAPRELRNRRSGGMVVVETGTIDRHPDREAHIMSLMERAKNILLQPKAEWPVIEKEQTTTGALYTGYIIPLAAIGPVAQIIGWSVIGMSLPFVGSFRVPIGYAGRAAVVAYVGALLGTFVLALIIDGLAPTFGGQKNQMQALKVAAYSSTAAWVAGIFSLFPPLAILSLLGLYSLYLLYLGLPVLMKAPEDKALGYTVVVIICAIVLYIVIAAITRQFMWRPTGMGLPGM